MRFLKVLALTISLALLLGAAGARAQESDIRETEVSRAELIGLIPYADPDPSRAVTPREGLTIVANALALTMGARDASFDNLAQSAPEEGILRLREMCMALSRAGARMGVPVRSDLEAPAEFSGTIGRSSYFATRDAAYQAPNGKPYENELLYAVAFACQTTSMTSDLALIDASFLLEQGLDAATTWAQAVAAALRLSEAVVHTDEQGDTPHPTGQSAGPTTPEDAKSSPAPEMPAEASETPKISWIEVTAPLVNIRAEASLESAVLSQASQGERYQNFGLTEGDWYIIEYEENLIGYISAQYCKRVEAAKPVAEGEVIGTVTVLTASAYVRSQPGNAGEPVYTAFRGQSFDCLGQEGNGWYEIRYADGDKIGYIYHKNCALSWFS